MGGSRGRAHRVRPGVSDPGRARSGSGGVRAADKQADIERVLAASGGVRRSLADLRAAADLEIANRPSLARYVIWTLAIATGQPISEIERVRVKDAPYLMEFARSRRVPDGVS